MSDNVKHWFTSFLIFFSIYISTIVILINFNDVFNNFSNKIIISIHINIVCLFGNVICFFNVWKYLKIEKCYRELEKQIICNKTQNNKYKFNEIYDWSSIIKDINIRKYIKRRMYKSFVIIASFCFIIIAISFAIMFNIFLFIN